MKKAIDILSGRTKKLIMMHRSADPDALGSAYAISRIFGGDIDVSGGLNRLARKLASFMDIKGIESPDYGNYDEIIVVDTASPAQLVTVPARISLLIDHHMQSDKWEIAEHRLVDESAPSCTYIIKKLIDSSGMGIDRETALALTAGIYTDTNYLSIGNAEMLEGLSELMNIADIDIGALREILDDSNMSIKIAVMKGLQRLKFDTFRGYMICTTHVSSFESMVASALIDSGADIAFVASPRDGEIRVSARASERVLRDGLHLGVLFKELGMEIDGEGGGHAGAAGFSTIGDTEAVLKMCMTKAEDVLRSQKS